MTGNMPPATKESFAKTVENLVKKFDADRETYVPPVTAMQSCGIVVESSQANVRAAGF
jgi:hypothetical protein